MMITDSAIEEKSALARVLGVKMHHCMMRLLRDVLNRLHRTVLKPRTKHSTEPRMNALNENDMLSIHLAA